MVTSSKLSIGSYLIVAVQLLISGCGTVEQVASGGSPIATNPAQDSQSYAQSAQDAATCALTNAPDSAPARLAAAKSREAADASAAATRAASELAAKRAAADRAERDVKAAEADADRANKNVMAHLKNEWHHALAARDQAFVNALTPDERIAYTQRGNLSPEADRRARSTPEYIAT